VIEGNAPNTDATETVASPGRVEAAA
jgi:hypothetical protein